MKHTPFYNIHLNLKGKLVPFAGYLMPVQYSGIIEETRSVRTSVGVFDVSHMGEIEIHGKDALAFLQKLTTNDIAALNAGRVQYSAMCYNDGGIVDDLLVYNLGSHFMLVVNAANKEKDLAWIKENIFGDVKILDKSDNYSLLAVQGPNSSQTLQKLTDINLSEMKYYTSTHGILAGVEMIISRTGYTGELGFELYFDSDVSLSEKIWNKIFEAGEEFNIKPVGLGARDVLRLEVGFCLYGNDIDQSTNPIEAGLGWITKLDKENFNGKDFLLKLKNDGLKRKLVGFIVEDCKGIPRQGYEIYSQKKSNSRQIGNVTSGSFSPTLECGIGMGYVQVEESTEGNRVDIIIRNKRYSAKIVKIPFINK